MSILGTIGGLLGGLGLLKALSGSHHSSSPGYGYQQTQVTPAPRTEEGKVIWADFMRQLYGSDWKPPEPPAPPPPIIRPFGTLYDPGDRLARIYRSGHSGERGSGGGNYGGGLGCGGGRSGAGFGSGHSTNTGFA